MGTTNSGNTIFFFPLSNILHLIVNFLCQPGVRGFERRFDRGGGEGWEGSGTYGFDFREKTIKLPQTLSTNWIPSALRITNSILTAIFKVQLFIPLDVSSSQER